LQDAKARFSELVRKVRSDGPQHVTVHGRRILLTFHAAAIAAGGKDNGAPGLRVDYSPTYYAKVIRLLLVERLVRA
jgi:hypothetical protein